MPWWGWMVIGAILLGAELFLVEADFYLVFLGISAVITGVVAAAVPALPEWVHWLVFAALALVSMLFFRRRVYQLVRGGQGGSGLRHDLVGLRLELPRRLAPGESCRIEYQGTGWTARNDGATIIEAGARVRVVATDGIILQVENQD